MRGLEPRLSKYLTVKYIREGQNGKGRAKRTGKGKTDYHCKIKETLFIQELEPALNVNVGSEKLMLY